MISSSFYKFFCFKYSFWVGLSGVSRQQSKKVIFALNRQKWRLILIVKKFQGISTISNLTIEVDFHFSTSNSWRIST